MELEKGYMQTEVGVIPSDWEVKELGEICHLSKTRINPVNSTENYKCVELEHLSQGSGLLIGYVDSKNLKSQKSLFVKGDVLFGKLRPYLKKYLLAKFDGVCTTEIWVLKSEKNISNGYLFYLVQSEKIIEAANLSTGTKMPRAEWKTVSATKIPVPTRSEQTAIAQALSDKDAYINSLEKLIEKKRQIKQGVMQELLKPKDGWEIKKLGEFNFDITDGNYSSKYPNSSEFKAIGIPFIRANNIRKMSILDNDMRFISPELHSELKKGHLKKNDILLTTRGEIGQVALVPDSHIDSNINAQLVRINTEEKIDTKFLAYFFTKSETQNEFMNAQTGSALKQLPINKLKEIQINYPSISIQKNISQILYDIDKDLFQLECNLGKAKSIKQGMMQNLLTGKIRLI